MGSVSEPEVWEACEPDGLQFDDDAWRIDSSTCGHDYGIWLARWDGPPDESAPEVWCTECSLTDLFPVSWQTIPDFEVRVRVDGTEVVHLDEL